MQLTDMPTLLQLPEKGQTTITRADRLQVFVPGAIKYYRHGWQSWSLAAWTDLTPLPIQKPDIFHPLQVDAVYARETRPNGSWLGAIELDDTSIVLLGALGLDAHVTLVNDQLSGSFESGNGEWFVARGDERAVFDAYVAELGRRFGRADAAAAPRVWCSWYSLYHAIDEKILDRLFSELHDLPFDVYQVDDGWQQNIGDWEPNAKFPSGMKALADDIKARGRRAGLWLAPLIATQSSRFFRSHRDWFLRDARGKLVSAGFNWGEPVYGLDTTHPGVDRWLVALLGTVRGWGFDYLKLDFLYAGALHGTRHKDQLRESAFRDAMKLMREAAGPDAFLLTCGTPILPALGVSDAMRVGPDVSHDWEKYRDARLLYNPSIPGARNAIRTVLHRAWLKPLVHLDPDIVYFESQETSMTTEQKNFLQDLARICEFKATSDLAEWQTNAEREELRVFLNESTTARQISRYEFEIARRHVDFSAVVAMPKQVRGVEAIWAAFLGWLGSFQFVLRIIKALDDKALRGRRASLEKPPTP